MKDKSQRTSRLLGGGPLALFRVYGTADSAPVSGASTIYSRESACNVLETVILGVLKGIFTFFSGSFGPVLSVYGDAVVGCPISGIDFRILAFPALCGDFNFSNGWAWVNGAGCLVDWES